MRDEHMGTCFVICPIGDEGTPERERSNDVFDFIIKPVAESLGYRPERTIEAPRPGWITERVIQHLTEDPMVVADLTDRNPNVFYELAIRHAARKPFVQLMQEGQEIPFDVHGLETIFFDVRNIRSVEGAKAKLEGQMRIAAAEPDRIRTPVSVAADLVALAPSGNPIPSLLSDLLEQQSSVMQRLDHLASMIAPGFPVERGLKLTSSELDQLADLVDGLGMHVGFRHTPDSDTVLFIDPRTDKKIVLDFRSVRQALNTGQKDVLRDLLEAN